MKTIVLTATIALFAAHVSAQSPSPEKENRGAAVSAVATEKQDNHSQTVKATAVNSRSEKDKADKTLKDKAEETAKVEKAAKAEKAGKEDRGKDDKTAEKPDNHGQEVKAVAQGSDLSGREKGQAVKAVASDKTESGAAASERAEKPAKVEKPAKADKPAHEARNQTARQNHRAARPPHGGAKPGPKGR
jgi:hypothetical protein